MIENFATQFRLLAPTAYHFVGGWVLAERNARVRQIRNLQEQTPSQLFAFIYSYLSFKLTDSISDSADVIYQFGSILPSLHSRPDFFLQLFSLSSQLLQRG